MIPDEEPRRPAPIGHNEPPSPIETVRGQMQDVVDKYRERVSYFAERANAKQVTDRITAGQAGDIVSLAGDLETLIVNDRFAITRPYREAADVGKAIADELWLPVEEALTQLRARLKAWNDEEDVRIETARREEQAFMAKARQAAAPAVEPEPAPEAEVETAPRKSRFGIDYSAPAVLSPRGPSAAAPLQPAKRRKVIGDLGSKSGNVDVTVYTITDMRALPDIILNSETVKNAALSVVKSLARHMPDIPGVEKSTATKLKVD